MVCVLILASGTIGYLGYVANQEIEKTVTDQFNRQQLILAREIAHDIRNHLSFLETMLLRINQFWEGEAGSTTQRRTDVESLFSLLGGWHVLAIAHVDGTGNLSAVCSEQGFSDITGLGIDYESYWEWGIEPEHRGETILGRTVLAESGIFKDRWLMVMATPTWKPRIQQGSDSGWDFEGLTFIIVDPIGISVLYTRDIRSGETGYAWVVDDKGTFMAHYEQSFIGENSFTVRQERNPRIPYTRINEILREHLLKGEEGTDWYISGWHRGVTGEMKKLFAYAPIFLSKEGRSNLWSVGVTAPVTEVYGIIESSVMRQWIIAGVFQLVFFSCLFVAIYFSLRWSRILQVEVDKKTSDLRSSEAEVRRERDKVKKSMGRLIEMQGKLIRSERFAAIGEAAAYLSHEIKNPLVVIGGFASQLEKSLAEDDVRRKKLNIIQDETRRLESMLTEVRDFTRPAKPKKQLHPLNPLIDRTLALMEDALAARGIHWDKSLDDKLPPLSIDSQQIEQLLINLVKNALEAMPHGGKLMISSWREDRYIKVSVVDTGAGMSPELVQKIFDPFYTTKKKGTGLGLAVSRKIMEDHEGEISVESDEGKGTRVTITFPMGTEERSVLVG